ncbi:MAG: archaeosortase/exosortase family protein [Chloroflexi bacterium]|nr:archaeosortase/exosortase family protein [Chloroflexota bacterium]
MFVGAVALLLYLYFWMVKGAWFQGFLALHATAAGWALNLTGAKVAAAGNVVSGASLAFTVVAECTALGASLIYTAAVIAYPAALRAKLLGVLAGTAALTVVNILRIVSLYYIGTYFPGALEAMHLVVWQALMVLLAVALWVLWTTQVKRDEVVEGHR